MKTAMQAVALGAGGFALVSLGGFAVWAFGGSWFYRKVGEAGLYTACAIVFIVLAGIFLHPLILGEKKVIRFYKSFIPAFFAYAIVWSVCWFLLNFGAGEWLGSLAGCAVFALLLARYFNGGTGLLKVVLVMFVAHSVGYFLGGIIYMHSKTPPEFLNLSRAHFSLLKKLLWGLCYGLGFGAGIGYAFHTFQPHPQSEPIPLNKNGEGNPSP